MRVEYEITCGKHQDIGNLSEEIAREQTVEMPLAALPETIRREIVGRVEATDLIPGSWRRFRVRIAYPVEITAYQIPQFLNILFGNISLKNFIRIQDVEFPPSFISRFQGPKFGLEGVREKLGVNGRPLAATALKPMGRSPEELAALAGAFALGGGDLIKDDHGLADHAFCPFRERVRQCREALDRAAQKTGKKTGYFPNVIGSHAQILEQAEFAASQGADGVLLAPFLTGLDTLREVSETFGLACMTHPAYTGIHFHDPAHGVRPAFLLGSLFRLCGADLSVFPNSGGRFGFTRRECGEIQDALLRPWGPLRPAWPVPAGGMSLESIPEMAGQYGHNAVYLIGGALLHPAEQLAAATKQFMRTLETHFPAAASGGGMLEPGT